MFCIDTEFWLAALSNPQILLIFGIVILLIYFRRNNKNYKVIPGPPPFPIFGNVLQFYKNPCHKFLEWSKIYGPVFKVKLLSEQIVIINDTKLIKDLFNNKFTTRRSLDNPVVYEMTQGCYGLVNSQGKTWEEQRLFTLKVLQDYGFNKTSMESIIIEEVKDTLKWLSKREGQPVQAVRLFNDAVKNVLWNIIFGERTDLENGQSEVGQLIGEMLSAFQKVTTNSLCFLPFMRHIFPETTGWNEYVKCTKSVRSIFRDLVEQRRLQCGGGGNNFIDTYIKKVEMTKDSNSSFFGDLGLGYKNLAAVIIDIIVGNSESSSLTLSWALLYLIHFPEIQAKIHCELDSVISNPLLCPSLSEKPNLPFLEAFIIETIRMSSVVALGFPHQVTEDFTFKSFFFKKGTNIIPNLYGVHHDPDVWGDPETFRPDRFLNAEHTQIVHDKNFIPFSDGKRKCIGEKLARDQLFLFLSGILNRFKVSLSPFCTKPDLNPKIGSMLLVPQKFDVVFTPRAQ